MRQPAVLMPTELPETRNPVLNLDGNVHTVGTTHVDSEGVKSFPPDKVSECKA